jgi:hypothetical protein
MSLFMTILSESSKKWIVCPSQYLEILHKPHTLYAQHCCENLTPCNIQAILISYILTFMGHFMLNKQFHIKLHKKFFV